MDRVPANRYLIFVFVAAAGCTADLATKAYMFSWPMLRAGQVFWLWEGYVGWQLSLNEGALFGMGQGKVWLFAALSVLAAVAIPVWLFWFRAARDVWITVALGGVMAGVLGNLYDRLGLPGEVWPSGARVGEPVFAVRDWILWQVNDRWRWPNFNLADSFLVVGAAILFLRAVTQPANSAPRRGQPAES